MIPAGRVRPAVPPDADAIAAAHVGAWKVAYRGMMPDEFLDGLEAGPRGERWREGLSAGGDGRRGFDGVVGHCLVVEDEKGAVVGIAVVGPPRDEGTGDEGELWMINVAPASWGKGYGRLLLAGATAKLHDLGYGEACLWVLAENERARRFYESAGWHPDGREKSDDFGGSALREVGYRRTLP